MEIRIESSQVLVVYLALVIFGIIYNQVVGWMKRKHYLEGYTSLAVGLGVLVTVGATAVFNWAYALLALGSFCASGLPVAAGSIWRHMRAREMEQTALRMDVTPGKFIGTERREL
jgi:hypothetical protein